MLGGFPLLKELDCWDNMYLAGNISSLRVLKETLESVRIINSGDVEGNFMDLADFPRLKGLDLGGITAVTGDIRDIHSEFFLRGQADDGGIPPSSNFASKSPNKSVNSTKLAATKKSKKRGTLILVPPFTAIC